MRIGTWSNYSGLYSEYRRRWEFPYLEYNSVLIRYQFLCDHSFQLNIRILRLLFCVEHRNPIWKFQILNRMLRIFYKNVYIYLTLFRCFEMSSVSSTLRSKCYGFFLPSINDRWNICLIGLITCSNRSARPPGLSILITALCLKCSLWHFMSQKAYPNP